MIERSTPTAPTTPASVTAAPGDRPVLEVRHLSKHYGAVRALHDVSLELRRGEIVGLVGDNGAGKSTLVNIIAGAVRPDTGEILLDGVAHAFETPAHARAAGVETVFQYLSIIPTLDIAENVFLNRELYRPGIRSRLRIMDRARMRREVTQGFERLGLQLPASTTKVGALSGGQRQAVAIARAVLWGQKIVLLDEPAAALGVKQTEILLRFIERLKQESVGVIFISHNMQQVMRVADRVVVMRLGQKAYDGPTAGKTASDIVALITGVRFFAEGTES
jgi:D-xylose transport system ATP-binding protein